MTLWRTFYWARLLFALFTVFIVTTAVLNISLAPQANTEVDALVARVGDAGDIPEIEVVLHQDGTDTVGGGLSRSIDNGLRTLDDLRLAVLDYASVNKVLVVAAAGNNAELGNQPNCSAAHLGGVEGGWAMRLSAGATGPTGSARHSGPDQSCSMPSIRPCSSASAACLSLSRLESQKLSRYACRSVRPSGRTR